MVGAVSKGCAAVLGMLLEQGGDPNAASPRTGQPLLLTAVLRRDIPSCTLLASAATADLERTDPHGQTALMGAARLGSVDLCRLLLDRGADPRAASTQGITVLVAGVTRYG